MNYVEIGRMSAMSIPGASSLPSRAQRQKVGRKESATERARKNARKASAKANAHRARGNEAAAAAVEAEADMALQQAIAEDAATAEVFVDEVSDSIVEVFSEPAAGGVDWRRVGLYSGLAVAAFFAIKKFRK